MLAIEKSGTGIPLVFLHAFPLSKTMWDASRPAYSKNFQFITVDFPGFGDSPLNAETTSMDDMADELEKTLVNAGIKEKIILAGLSMGGYASFRFYAKYPERVRSLALLSTRAAADSDASRQKRAENIALIEKEGLKPFAERMVQGLLGKTTHQTSPAIVEQVRAWILAANPKAVIAALRGMATRPDSTTVLAQISVPTFLLAGEEDTVVPASEMKEIAGKIKKADFQSLPVGHLSALEQPAAFQNAFLTFLKRRVL